MTKRATTQALAGAGTTGRCSRRRPAGLAVNRTRARLTGRGPLGACFLLTSALLGSMAVPAAAGNVPGASGGDGSGSGGSSGAGPVTTSFPGTRPPSGQWPYPNGDLANTRNVTGSTVSSANVSRLQEAWAFDLAGPAAAGTPPYGSLTAGPVVQGGVVYLQDQDANVYALALATGKLLWEYQLNAPETSGPGPDGVAVAGGAVYGDTSTTAFALNETTGKPMWVDRSLLRTGQGAFEIQPQVAAGRVFLASAHGPAPGGGVLMALNAANGHLLWEFRTVVQQSPGVEAIGVGSGGAWEPPLVGNDGSVTFGVGNPYQSIASAIKYPLRQLYTDSEVNLNAATGKLRWYYQAVPDDFEDHDLQASPVSTSINGAPVIVTSGKVGIVYALNARSGALIWKTPVGEHNGHDNDAQLAVEHKLKITLPYTIEPGPLGGVLSNLAVADGSVYVATIDLPVVATTLNSVDGNKSAGVLPTGEVEALNLATGKVEWDTKVPEMPLGAATVSNDLVFTDLYNGMLMALNRSTGAIVYRHQLPTSANAPIAVFGNTVLVPAGGPETAPPGPSGHPQLVAYTVP
jgi:outer membrane protein assembly factor BamB